jgi:hypothetical protein
MKLIVQSWVRLLYFDILMCSRKFETVHAAVRRQRTCAPDSQGHTYIDICYAMDLACVFYFKRVLCLQRSAATAVLLRRHGWNAEMVIGAQILPFQSHAWVEIGDRVVNDKPYVTEMFQVLERC